MKARLEFDAPESCVKCNSVYFEYDSKHTDKLRYLYCRKSERGTSGKDADVLKYKRAPFCPLKIIDEQTIGERMTEEEREAIRKRKDRILAMFPYSVLAGEINELGEIVNALLSALETETKISDGWQDLSIEHAAESMRMMLERDRWKVRAGHAEEMLREYEPTERQAFITEITRWKARAEALERAIKDRCEFCIKNNLCIKPGECTVWEFDEARFSQAGDRP